MEAAGPHRVGRQPDLGRGGEGLHSYPARELRDQGGGARGRGWWGAGILTHHSALPQVTELRGLSSLAVGAVTCDITDFFTTRPQVIVVDITELGTIKLQLEVLWK